MLTLDELKKAISILRKNEIRESTCIKCGDSFYMADEHGFREQTDITFCECGGEIIIRTKNT